ncbi:MAG: hypothetical protein HYZ00_09085, partial [Candidatus Hydrogenedentes bacterium]|nr:hypothetical protein [Candidatus Hydrogenedentota bacterium]
MDSSRLDTQARLRSAIAGWRAEVGAAQETLTSQIAQTNTQLQRLVNELANRNDCALALAAAQNDLRRLRRLLPEGAEEAAESGGVFTPLEVMRQELLDGFERYRAAVTAWTTEVTGAHQGLSDQIALANGQFAVLLARLDGRGEEDTGEHGRPQTAGEQEGTGAQVVRGQEYPRSAEEWQDCLPQVEEQTDKGEECGQGCARSGGEVDAERDYYRDLLAHVEGQRDAHFRTLQTMGQRCAYLEEEVARLHASLQERALARRPLLALGETLERLQRLCETRRAGALIAPVEEAVQRLRVEMAARGVAGAALTQAQQECEILRAQAGLLEHELEDARRQAERLREEREVLQRDATERELLERE